jgi:hypothetical protein
VGNWERQEERKSAYKKRKRAYKKRREMVSEQPSSTAEIR